MKFWKQPSVTTKAGRKVQKEKFVPLERWENSDRSPFIVMSLRYHTQQFMQILKAQATGTTHSVESYPRRPLSTTAPPAKRSRVMVDLTDECNVKVDIEELPPNPAVELENRPDGEAVQTHAVRTDGAQEVYSYLPQRAAVVKAEVSPKFYV
jgi:hypothetical protein